MNPFTLKYGLFTGLTLLSIGRLQPESANCIEAIGVAWHRALTLARTTYAIFVGSEHMLPPISSVEQRALFDAFLSRFGVPSVIATAGR